MRCMLNKPERLASILKQVDPSKPKHSCEHWVGCLQGPHIAPSKALWDGDLPTCFRGHLSSTFCRSKSFVFSLKRALQIVHTSGPMKPRSILVLMAFNLIMRSLFSNIFTTKMTMQAYLIRFF